MGVPCARWESFAYRALIDPNQGQDANRTDRRRAQPLRRNGRRDRNGPQIHTQQPASLRRVRILRAFQAHACARRLPALELSLAAARSRERGRACVKLESWILLVPRTRSSHNIAANAVANFGFKSGTRIIDLLVSFDSEVRTRVCRKVQRTSESGH
jgi:hypothetical protein